MVSLLGILPLLGRLIWLLLEVLSLFECAGETGSAHKDDPVLGDGALHGRLVGHLGPLRVLLLYIAPEGGGRSMSLVVGANHHGLLDHRQGPRGGSCGGSGLLLIIINAVGVGDKTV